LNWTVYILQCGDGTLYTGITNDLERRMAEHEAGHGAKYTKGRDKVDGQKSKAFTGFQSLLMVPPPLVCITFLPAKMGR
jgi:predicted GIY-YIG superfamily endonuclease